MEMESMSSEKNDKLFVLKRGDELGNDSTIFIMKLIFDGL